MKALLLLLTVFVIGVASGVGGGLLVLRSMVRESVLAPVEGPGPVDRVTARIESKLTSALELTDSERLAVHEELATSARRAKEIRHQLVREIQTLASDTQARIGMHLPPHKRQKLREEAGHHLEPWGFNLPSEP